MLIFIWIQKNSGKPRVFSLSVCTCIISSVWTAFLKGHVKIDSCSHSNLLFIFLSKVRKLMSSFLPKLNFSPCGFRVHQHGCHPQLGRIFAWCWNSCQEQEQLEVIATNDGKIYVIFQFFAMKQCLIFISQRMGRTIDQAMPLCSGLVFKFEFLTC